VRGSSRTGRRLAVRLAFGTALLALLVPATSSAADYVAMGDSYSSGTGTRDYYDTTCERSNFSYSKLIDQQIPGTTFLAACGGAKTNHIDQSGQKEGYPRQIDARDPPGTGALVLDSGTDYATISIGGNDAGFTDVLLACGEPSWIGDCDAAVNEAQAYIRDTLPAQLDRVYNSIRGKSASARVTVVGYPRIFNGEDCNAATFFSASEMTRLNQTADLLADTTRARAQAHGFGFADSRGAFLGHAVCDDTEWLNGLSNPTTESYHPNKLGHSNGYAGIVKAALLAQAIPRSIATSNGRIAFARGASGSEDVYAINANGSFYGSLPFSSSASDVDPAWSADGTKIAFASNRSGADYEIYTANADGTGLAQLTSNGFDDLEPAWSPNGVSLAFRSARDGNNEIYKMTSAGGSQTRLTSNSVSDFAPAWSPDGAEIAYQRFGTQNDVYKMNADGQGQTQLTTDGANDGAPSWSADGSQIAFHSNRGGDFEIFTMTSGGGSQTQRTSNAFDDEEPAWSPSGGLIAFHSNRDGNDEIYTMTSTGSSQTRRTTDVASDVAPTWQADGVAPQTTITGGPSGATNSATPQFTFTSSEAGSSFDCSVDGASFAACSSPHQTAELEDGDHTVRVRAIDPAGNVDGTPAERAFTVDTTPAGTAITSGPRGPTNDSTPTFEFAASDPEAQFQCRVDDDAFVPCSSPFTTRALAEGSHTFTVVGTDGSGANPETRSASFTVDTTSPETFVVSGPGERTNQPQPIFELGSSEGATFECRLDGAAWSSCPPTFSPAQPLADGQHTFETRATDAAGNVDLTPAASTFTLDTVKPTPSFDEGPPEKPQATPDSTPSFSFSSEADGRFECRLDSLDGASWAACASPFTTDELGDGSHVFEIRAIDQAGNVSDPATREFIVDATAPETTIVGGPGEGGATNTGTPAFTFESDDPDATFECRVDSISETDPWAHCEPGQPLGVELADGNHRFEVRAVDQLDNRDPSAAVRSFEVDTVAPDTTITSDPGALTTDPTPEFRFDSPDDPEASFECRFDAGEFRPCASPYSPSTALPDGSHTFDVRAVDRAGNRDEDPSSRSFTVDTTKPVLIISGPTITNDTTPTFTLSTNEPLRGYECRGPGVATTFEECSSPLTTSELAPGEYILDVRANDVAGNLGEQSHTFTIDTTKPTTSLIDGPAGRTADPTPSFTFRAGSGDANASFECRVDSASFSGCGSPFTSERLADGEHVFEVRAVDAAGNRDGTPATRSFSVDTTPPRTTIDSGPSGETFDRTPTFAFSASEAGSRFACWVDNRESVPCSSPYTPGELAYGEHTFAVRATDSLGNVERPAATRGFKVKPPSNRFSFGKLRRNRRKGSATLAVELPGAGKLELRGDDLERVTRKPGFASTVKLPLVAAGRAARQLSKRGAVEVKAKVRFTPRGGAPRTKSMELRLVKRDRNRG